VAPAAGRPAEALERFRRHKLGVRSRGELLDALAASA
jgi:hypothetical protein